MPGSMNGIEFLLRKLLNEHFPNEWQWSGSGEGKVGTRFPDFISSNGRKLIIELFGNHWHQPEDEGRRVEYFAKHGFRTLVIWQDELKRPNDVIEKIRVFATQVS